MLRKILGVLLLAHLRTAVANNDTTSSYIQKIIDNLRPGFVAKYLSGFIGGAFEVISNKVLPSQSGFGAPGLPASTTPSLGLGNESVAIDKTAPINSRDENYSWKYYVPEEEISVEGNIRVDQNVPDGPGAVATGSFGFSAPNGEQFKVTYTADERGFIAAGAHLPTAPPIPEHVLLALIQNAIDEAAGIFDDGSYKEIVNETSEHETKIDSGYAASNMSSLLPHK